jgi:pyridoxal 5'-phosphate synthase pdxT subunit
VLRVQGLDPEELVSVDGKEVRRQDNVEEKFNVIIAVRQAQILATAFHPELTDDLRWHQYFLDMVKESI